MKKPRKKSNMEVLVNLMNYSKHGPLMQGFIMNGLERQAQEVLQHDEAPEGWPPFINWDAWKGCAQEIATSLNKHYEAT